MAGPGLVDVSLRFPRTGQFSRQGPPTHQRSLGPHCGLELVQRGVYLCLRGIKLRGALAACVGQVHAEKAGQQGLQRI